MFREEIFYFNMILVTQTAAQDSFYFISENEIAILCVTNYFTEMDKE